MSNTKNIPSRINGKRNSEYHKEYNKEYRKPENPITKRDRNRKSSQKYRETHSEQWYDYFKPYFKNWYRQNKEIHFLRNKTSCIKVGLLNGAKLGYDNTCILENLRAVGWSENLTGDKCLNHKISIKLFCDFNKKIPAIIVFDKDNIEVILKTENNSAKYREVTNETIELASKLESKYQNELKGFTAFVNRYKGRII